MEIQRTDKITIRDKEIKLSVVQLLEKMKFLTNRGFECWVEGQGDGGVNFIFEKINKTSINQEVKHGTHKKRTRRSR